MNVNAPTATQAERLRAELVEAAAVEQAGACRCASFSARLGTVRKPSESVPQTPAMPCAAMRADRVVDPEPLDEQDAETTITPATKPIRIAAHGATNAHAAVIATSARDRRRSASSRGRAS